MLFQPFDCAGKVEAGRTVRRHQSAHKHQGFAAANHFPARFDIAADFRAADKFAGESNRQAKSTVQDFMRKPEQREIRKGHQAAAMHHAAGMHVLRGRAKRANRPFRIGCEIERPSGLILKRLVRPHGPALELPRCFDLCGHLPLPLA